MATEQQQAQTQPQVVMASQPQPQVVYVQQPATQTPTQQVVIVKQEKPYPSFVENKYLMGFIMLGIVFLLVGSILVNIAPVFTNKNYANGGNRNDDLVASNSVTYTGNVFKCIGVFFVFAFILLAAVLRTDLSDHTRFGLLLLLGLIMFATRFTLP